MSEHPTERPRLRGVILALFLAVLLGACRPALAPAPADPLHVLRGAADASPGDGEAVGRWLLAELLIPGGTPAKALAARRRLDATEHRGMFGSLARAIDDEAHGRFRSAAAAHMDVLEAARKSSHSLAPLAGWFSARHLLSLRSSVAGLWEQARVVVERSIAFPGNLGWRARSELVEWWGADGFRAGGKDGRSRAEALAQRYGCIEHARLAGPFGNLAPGDHRTHFEAERPGPWPFSFPRSKRQKEPPFVIPTEIRGCTISAAESVFRGIYYVETFIDLPAEREAIIAVQGAYAIYVDDVEVLTRGAGQWGIWPRFGARVRIGAGRHRIVARIMQPETAIRLLAPDGTPLGVKSSDDPAPPYTLKAPGRLSDPNVLDPFLTRLGVPPQPGAPNTRAGASGGASDPSLEHPEGGLDVDHPIARFLAAYLAHVDGQNDVSSVLIEPLVAEPSRATGPALAMQAVFLEKDPIFPENDARDLVKDIRARAAAKDPELWWPRYWLALDEADKAGVPEVASKIAALANHFREVPDILSGLITIYGRMGWRVEHSRTVKEAAARFPDDIDAQYSLLKLLDAQGDIAEADHVAARIRKLDPETELDFERAIEREDYPEAIREIERISRRRKDRRDIAARISGLLTRAGSSSESLESLERALAKDPANAEARLSLADARTARGDQGALRRALVDAIQTGSDTASLRDAIELVEGTTELTPFRRDGSKIIAEFEAKKPELPGTAARVLDYAAIWIHADGSARMLEHEIIRIQSREGIQEHAEQRVPNGLVLKLRTIKKDGRILEPEFVDGKPTVTMPHLEVDDYIETESLISLRGDGRGGRMFQGPRWFFREEKIPYWRSEFVAISPKNRPLDIETGGSVPEPLVTESGALVMRRWRVDQSPALPEEPASAPLSEFLPNVRIGWGVNLNDAIDRAVDANADETPRDPRLYRMALAIANAEPPGTGILSARQKDPPPVLKGTIDDRARRIYRWVVANVEPGNESDGRRVVVGKSGNRVEAFLYLCRLIGIDVSIAAVRDRLTPPSRGPMSEAESFNSGALRIVTERGPRWMIVQNKYAPYGYLPSSLRGQPAVILKPGAPREITPTTGSRDVISYRGVVDLASDGSAKLTLEQSFEGKFAIHLRSLLETVPDARLEEVIESFLLSPVLPGATLRAFKVKDLADLDAPLTLAMELEMGNFARVRGNEIVLAPPFALHLAGLASLSSRETPLYISEDAARTAEVKLSIRLPAGAHVATPLAAAAAENDDRVVSVRDRLERNALLFERFVDLPAGRVNPGDYASFQTFVQLADAALNREVVISLSKALKQEGRPPPPAPQGAPK